jgi:hypothetical protein
MNGGHINFTIIREEFNEYELENGLHLRVKPIVTDIVTKGKDTGFAIVFDIFSKVISPLDDIANQRKYDETKSLSFRSIKEVVNIYETKAAIILVIYRLDKLLPTTELNREGIPILRIEGNTLVNVVKRPNIGGSGGGSKDPTSHLDRDLFRNIFWARVSERYRDLIRNKASIDFIFDIEGVRRPLQEGGLEIQGFEQPFIEDMLKEIQDQDGFIELIPNQRRFHLTKSGVEYCKRLPETHTQ